MLKVLCFTDSMYESDREKGIINSLRMRIMLCQMKIKKMSFAKSLELFMASFKALGKQVSSLSFSCNGAHMRDEAIQLLAGIICHVAGAI